MIRRSQYSDVPEKPKTKQDATRRILRKHQTNVTQDKVPKTAHVTAWRAFDEDSSKLMTKNNNKND